MSLEITTKYSPATKVYLVLGAGDKAKVIESKIHSVDITATARGTQVTYNCQISRKAIGTEVSGMPDIYTVPRTDKMLFDTAEDCINSIVIKQ